MNQNPSDSDSNTVYNAFARALSGRLLAKGDLLDLRDAALELDKRLHAGTVLPERYSASYSHREELAREFYAECAKRIESSESDRLIAAFFGPIMYAILTGGQFDLELSSVQTTGLNTENALYLFLQDAFRPSFLPSGARERHHSVWGFIDVQGMPDIEKIEYPYQMLLALLAGGEYAWSSQSVYEAVSGGERSMEILNTMRTYVAAGYLKELNGDYLPTKKGYDYYDRIAYGKKLVL